MKTTLFAALVILTACSRPAPDSDTVGERAVDTPPEATTSGSSSSSQPSTQPSTGSSTRPSSTTASSVRGPVLETIVAGPYTYVQVEAVSGGVWAAAPNFPVEVGDEVVFSTAMPMRNYVSRTLERTFELVYFTSNIQVLNRSGGGSPTSTQRSSRTPTPTVDLSGIETPEGGKTVADIHAEASGLEGDEVLVRGRVVKFTGGVLGKNWIHVQDGSGEGATADLTVVTSDSAAVGDLVLVSGTVATDRDLGFGYHYPVLLEEARLTKE